MPCAVTIQRNGSGNVQLALQEVAIYRSSES